jgi:hypothetical protein
MSPVGILDRNLTGSMSSHFGFAPKADQPWSTRTLVEQFAPAVFSSCDQHLGLLALLDRIEKDQKKIASLAS